MSVATSSLSQASVDVTVCTSEWQSQDAGRPQALQSLELWEFLRAPHLAPSIRVPKRLRAPRPGLTPTPRGFPATFAWRAGAAAACPSHALAMLRTPELDCPMWMKPLPRRGCQLRNVQHCHLPVLSIRPPRPPSRLASSVQSSSAACRRERVRSVNSNRVLVAVIC